MTDDRAHADEHRPPLLELREDEPVENGVVAARWPRPFVKDDVDLAEDATWWYR